MKFFIDTAEVTEIKAASELGLVDGVTTNPSLIAKSGRDFREVITEIAALVDGPNAPHRALAEEETGSGAGDRSFVLTDDLPIALDRRGQYGI